jgi:hypothetical protein
MIRLAKRSRQSAISSTRADKRERVIFLLGFVFVNIALVPLFREGHIVFSDIAIGTSADRYLEEITGVWNQRWSTANFFNLSRLLFVAPFYAITQLTGGSGSTLVKLLILTLVNITFISFLIFSRSVLTRAIPYITRDRQAIAVACVLSAIFYAMNPWLMTRIQHLYLLCGYALFPLVTYSGIKLFSLRSSTEHLHCSWKISFDTFMRAALFALLFSIACASVHYGIYMLPVLAMVLVHSSLNSPLRSSTFILLQQFIRLSLAIGLFIVISFHWIAPIIHSYLQGYGPGQNNVNVVETIMMFSRNSDWLSTVSGISYWWPMFSLEDLPISFRISQAILLAVITLGLIQWFKYSSKLLVVTTVLLSIIATGAHYTQMAEWYVDFVLSDRNMLGFLFRDPNKLVGPLLLALSIFLCAGILQIIHLLRHYFSPRYVATSYLILIIVLLFYLAPFWQNYILGFYAPVLVPDEYRQVKSELQQRLPESGRVVYLPSADNMVQPELKYSAFDWNKAKIDGRYISKASGSFTVFDSLVDTLYQHEGSPQSVDYFLNYLQHLIDKGSTRHIAELISLSGATHMIYQSDYVGQQKRHAFNLDVLKHQQGLELVYTNRIFHLFAVKEPQARISALETVIHTPYGLNRLLLYKTMGQEELKNADVQFISATSTFNYDSIREGDFMEVRKLDDWLLSGLPPESVIYPFEQINEGNPFLKWSKTFVSGQDWQFYLKRENIHNVPFDFDYSKGLIFTVAPVRINVAPYQLDTIVGDEVLTSGLFVDDEPIFHSLEPDKLKIRIQPEPTQNSLLDINGEYTAAALTHSLIAAESRAIPVAETTPYRLSFYLNTDRASSVQVRVLFMDHLGQKIGSEFVASSDPSARKYDSIPIGFAFVTPHKAAQLKIEFLSKKLKNTHAEWSVEDLSLQSLSKFASPNKITLNAVKFAGKSGQLYIRLFKSKAGGKLKVTSNGVSNVLNTLDPNRSSFQWVNAGHFSFGNDKQSLQLDNQLGLNAINALALIDDDNRQNLEQTLQQKFEESRLFLSLDAEADFSSTGQHNDHRTYADLHGGKGVRSSGGELRTNFDIVKSSIYSLSLQAAVGQGAQKTEVSIIEQSSGKIVWTKIISPSLKARPLSLYSDDTQGKWSQPLLDVPESNDFISLWQGDEITLNKGQYYLLIRFPEIKRSSLNWVQLQSSDVTTTALPQINTVQTSSPNNWSALTSARVSVKAGQQHLLEMDFSSILMGDLHLKIKYLDLDKNEISVIYFNRQEWKLASGNFKFSQVITAPLGAQWAELQILGKQIQPESELKVRSSSLTDYAILPLIDWVLINEATPTLPSLSPKKRRKVQSEKLEAGIYKVDNQPQVSGIKLLESPSVLWQLETDGKRIKPFVVNGLSNAYQFEQMAGKTVIRYLPQRTHHFGLYLLGLFLVLFIGACLIWAYQKRFKK